jgi:hypothetical protein
MIRAPAEAGRSTKDAASLKKRRQEPKIRNPKCQSSKFKSNPNLKRQHLTRRLLTLNHFGIHLTFELWHLALGQATIQYFSKFILQLIKGLEARL